MKRVTYILTVAAVMLAVTALADESRLMPYLDYGKMNATIDDQQPTTRRRPTTDSRLSNGFQLSVAECRMSLKLES